MMRQNGASRALHRYSACPATNWYVILFGRNVFSPAPPPGSSPGGATTDQLKQAMIHISLPSAEKLIFDQ
jgi:hypothetical protein